MPFYAVSGALTFFYAYSDVNSGTVANAFEVSGRGRFSGLHWRQHLVAARRVLALGRSGARRPLLRQQRRVRRHAARRRRAQPPRVAHVSRALRPDRRGPLGQHPVRAQPLRRLATTTTPRIPATARARRATGTRCATRWTGAGASRRGRSSLRVRGQYRGRAADPRRAVRPRRREQHPGPARARSDRRDRAHGDRGRHDAAAVGRLQRDRVRRRGRSAA